MSAMARFQRQNVAFHFIVLLLPFTGVFHRQNNVASSSDVVPLTLSADKR